jgi:hypothetical protein
VHVTIDVEVEDVTCVSPNDIANENLSNTLSGKSDASTNGVMNIVKVSTQAQFLKRMPKSLIGCANDRGQGQVKAQ